MLLLRWLTVGSSSPQKNLIQRNVGLVVAFALLYFCLSGRDPEAFSRPLDGLDALYFATCTQSTVGLGDVAPRSRVARVAVTIHIIATIYVNLFEEVIQRSDGPAFPRAVRQP